MAILHEPEFWVTVAFVILIAGVWRPVRRALTTGLDERARTIRGELGEAKRLRDEAERVLADYRKKQTRTPGEVAAIAKQATDDVDRVRQHAEAELAASLARREQQAKDRIAQAEAEAIAEVRALAVDLAIAATRTLLRDSLDPARAASLVDRSIADLPQRLR